MKHLCSQNEEELENEEESSILSDFSVCMYQHEQKSEFQEAFVAMGGKLANWLGWRAFTRWDTSGLNATCYVQDVFFSIGMWSTQLSDSLNKEYYIESASEIKS